MPEITQNYKTPENNKRSVWDIIFRPFNFFFYCKCIRIIINASKFANKDNFYEIFIEHCGQILRTVEATGANIEISGLENVPQQPSVIVGNHFSTLETISLGHVLKDRCKITFVIKESLMKYPYFNKILSRLSCITVTRTNPVHDLKKILKDGPDLLEKGYSIIIFPQHTRGEFNPEDFSSIACKLAKRANVPIVPLALDTRLWGKGKIISDLGPVSRNIPVRYAFGEPLLIEKNEKEIHAQCLDFIQKNLQEWGTY
jgi:1-acyl-sn-glycerol-3-phosphate acyltransferase